MLLKPPLWSVSRALIAPEARGLWKGVAFVFPAFAGAHLGGGGLLLGPTGAPLHRISLVAGAAAERRATPFGSGVGISGSSNLLQRDDYEPVVTSDGAGAGDFTILVLANPIAEARISWGVAQGNTANNTNLWMGFNNAAGSVQTAEFGTLTFSTRNLNSPSGVAAPSAIDGKYHLFCGRRSGAIHDCFVDGILRASESLPIRDIATGDLGLAIGQRPEGTAFRLDTACNIVLASAWNRALSDAEVRLLAQDPFIMLRPVPEWRKVWTPLGGDAVLNPADLAHALDFEMPALSQTYALSPADAVMQQSFETPGLSLFQDLNIDEMAFSQNLEAAGFSQLHGLEPLEMSSAVFLDAPALVLSSAGAPGFRTTTPAQRRKVKVPGPDNRTAQP